MSNNGTNHHEVNEDTYEERPEAEAEGVEVTQEPNQGMPEQINKPLNPFEEEDDYEQSKIEQIARHPLPDTTESKEVTNEATGDSSMAENPFEMYDFQATGDAKTEAPRIENSTILDSPDAVRQDVALDVAEKEGRDPFAVHDVGENPLFGFVTDKDVTSIVSGKTSIDNMASTEEIVEKHHLHSVEDEAEPEQALSTMLSADGLTEHVGSLENGKNTGELNKTIGNVDGMISAEETVEKHHLHSMEDEPEPERAEGVTTNTNATVDPLAMKQTTMHLPSVK